MKKILKQPLVHFLLAGIGLFILYEVLNPKESDYKTVVVDKQALLTHLQYRSKAFNKQVFEQQLKDMQPEELDQIIDEYIREEVLFREATALGLDQEDYVIKRRMIQKVEFMTEGVAEALTDISDQDLEQFYSENRDKYYQPAQVTFTHVFFNSELQGDDESLNMANAELIYLNNNKVPFEMATSRGDRFLYHTNYVERDPEYVASHFGRKMSEEVFELEPSEGWQGPVRSIYGQHLILLTSKEEGKYPALSEIADRVRQDAIYWKKQRLNQETIDALIDTYRVELKYQQEI